MPTWLSSGRLAATLLVLPVLLSSLGCGVAAMEGIEAAGLEARAAGALAAAPEIGELGLGSSLPSELAIGEDGIGYINGNRAFTVDMSAREIRSLSPGRRLLATFDATRVYSASGTAIADIDTIVLRRSSLFDFGSVRSTRVAVVPAGARVRVLAVRGGWEELGFPEGVITGWAFAPLLKMRVSGQTSQPLEYRTQPREAASIGAVLSSADAVRNDIHHLLGSD